MRLTRLTPLATLMGTMLMAPAPAPAAASKEMQDLSRDIGELSDQLKDLQKSLLDPKTGIIVGLQSMIQQALDTANKTNSNVSSLNTGMMQTMQTSLKGLSDQLASVAALASTVSSMSGDVSNLGNTMQELQRTVNKQGQMLTDISNQLKLMQAPAAAPPGADPSSMGPTAGAAPPPTGESLFSNAARDQNSGKYELAISEYQEFLKLYPDDINAIRAQYNIGAIYYSLSKPAEAVKALNVALEQYQPDQKTTPSIYFMKGMALKQLKDKPGAIASFKTVVTKYPHADEAEQAKTQLTTLNATVAPARKPAH